MDLKPRRVTRFPGLDQTGPLKVHESNVNLNRQTRFPGGTDLQKISVLEEYTPLKENKLSRGDSVEVPSRLPLKINPPTSIPAKPQPVMTIKTRKEEVPPPLRLENPWNVYTAIRKLERGGEVTAACTQVAPIKMVAVKKLLSENFKELARFQHENLLTIIEAFRFDDTFFIVTDYTVTTLTQIIAIPLPLEEMHVSATCFEGMQHLSRFGLGHMKLDSSKILFSIDGGAKIAHFDDCQSTESASARSLGVIAIEMMQNGIPPETDGKFVLKHPDRWSPEASNFLEITSWGTLKDLHKNRFLKHISHTVMIPFIEYARWDTIESFSIKTPHK